jgi:hypothetical protein
MLCYCKWNFCFPLLIASADYFLHIDHEPENLLNLHVGYCNVFVDFESFLHTIMSPMNDDIFSSFRKPTNLYFEVILDLQKSCKDCI